jgi:2,3,4,5-tetrahydropyridine-2-carboxylate N-succinyltransferase
VKLVLDDNLEKRFNNFASTNKINESEAKEFFSEIRIALERGIIRAAVKKNEEWIVNEWVKEAILFGFKMGVIQEFGNEYFPFFDKDTLPLLNVNINNKIRIVPGGSSIRGGAYVSEGTILMPPSYVNIGAYIDKGCMIDSHSLVGSCAQIGKNVHISAASQIGGVLEPRGAFPVIIENDVFIGGNCGIYEGIIVKEKAIIGSGVILNSSIPVFDNTTGNFLCKSRLKPLTIPSGAVVIPGSRPINSILGKEKNIHIYCPVIIKYRDNKTESSVIIEQFLR